MVICILYIIYSGQLKLQVQWLSTLFSIIVTSTLFSIIVGMIWYIASYISYIVYNMLFYKFINMLNNRDMNVM